MSGPDERPRPDGENPAAPAAPPPGRDASTSGVGLPERVPPDLEPTGDDAPRADSWGAGAPAPSTAATDEPSPDPRHAHDAAEPADGPPVDGDAALPGLPDDDAASPPADLPDDEAPAAPADLPDDLPADLARDGAGPAAEPAIADGTEEPTHASTDPDGDDAVGDLHAHDGRDDADGARSVGADPEESELDEDAADEDADAYLDEEDADGPQHLADPSGDGRDGAAGAPGALARGGRRWPLAVLAGVTALAVGGATALGLAALDARDDADDRDQALRVAREASRVLFSYDHRRLQSDFAKALALTAGDFREDYERTTTRVVADVAARYKAVVTAEHVASGVVPCVDGRVAVPDGKTVPCRDGEVHVVVFLNQVTTSTRVTGQKVDPSRVRMTLREVDGAWKVVGVTAL